MNLLYVIVFILFVCYLYKYNTEHYEQAPIIWMYWEQPKNKKKRADYLNLCLETVYKHCSNNFKIIILNEKTVYDYIPNLRKDLDKLLIPQKVDYIRIHLLYKYGGIWLDFDTIVMRNLSPIIEKLKTYDFVGFGCTGKYCTNGYPRPSNWMMAARKGSILMKNIISDSDLKLNKKNQNYQYFDLGKKIIWKHIRLLQKKQNYKYYHYDSAYDGSRMANKRWVRPEYYYKSNIKLMDESKLFVVFLTNTTIDSRQKTDNIYKNFVNMNKDQILSQDYWISKMFRKSLDY